MKLRYQFTLRTAFEATIVIALLAFCFRDPQSNPGLFWCGILFAEVISVAVVGAICGERYFWVTIGFGLALLFFTAMFKMLFDAAGC